MLLGSGELSSSGRGEEKASSSHYLVVAYAAAVIARMFRQRLIPLLRQHTHLPSSLSSLVIVRARYLAVKAATATFRYYRTNAQPGRRLLGFTGEMEFGFSHCSAGGPWGVGKRYGVGEEMAGRAGSWQRCMFVLATCVIIIAFSPFTSSRPLFSPHTNLPACFLPHRSAVTVQPHSTLSTSSLLHHSHDA